jgi:chromosome partitioning protein
MRRIALINQKGGVGKTTSTVNLGAALARAGRRVVMVDLDPQANLSLHVDVQLAGGEPSTYSVLLGNTPLAAALRDTRTPGLRVLPSCIDLSGAELELANAFGREMILRDALDSWEKEHREQHGEAPADYVLLDCPPSLGLLSVNGLVAAHEAFLAVQTEFFALQGMTKLVDVVQLLRRRLNPKLEITGILPCLYDNRTKLAREVIAELRTFFPGRVFTRAIAKSVKLAEAPSYGQTIFEYAPESTGALDYTLVAQEVIAQEARDAELAQRVANTPIVVAAPREARKAKKPAVATESAPEALREVVIQPAPPTKAGEPVVDGPRALEALREIEPLRVVEVAVLEQPRETLREHDEPRFAEPARVLELARPSEALQAVEAPHVNGVLIDELPELPPDAELLEGFDDN